MPLLGASWNVEAGEQAPGVPPPESRSSQPQSRGSWTGAHIKWGASRELFAPSETRALCGGGARSRRYHLMVVGATVVVREGMGGQWDHSPCMLPTKFSLWCRIASPEPH